MNKKKVLIIHPALAPYRVDFFNSLNENYDVKFYFFNKNLLNQKFEQDDLKKQLDFTCNYLKKGFNINGRSFRFGIKKIIREFQPDIVVCPEYNLINLSILFYRLLSKKKYKIITICDDSIHVAKKVPFYKKAIRSFFLKTLDAVIFTHQEIINWYILNLRSNAKLFFFPIIRREEPYVKQLECSNQTAQGYMQQYSLQNKKILLFVGRLVAVKNLEFLLEAFTLVNKKDKNVVLVIIGSGVLESSLRNKIYDLALNDFVLMPGRFEGNSLFAWYNIANIFVLPSVSEPFGAVINEALLAGCYVLSSKLAGGASLIVEDINGNTFDPYNKEEIAKVILLNLNKNKLFKKPKINRENRMIHSYEYYFDNFIKTFNEI